MNEIEREKELAAARALTPLQLLDAVVDAYRAHDFETGDVGMRVVKESLVANGRASLEEGTRDADPFRIYAGIQMYAIGALLEKLDQQAKP